MLSQCKSWAQRKTQIVNFGPVPGVVMKRWSRRKFMKAGVVASIAISGGTAATLSSAHAEGRTRNLRTALESRERDLLRVVMDEIIPAGDGMPAASEVGGVDYLDQLATRDKETAKELRESLAALEELSKKGFEGSFLSLSRKQRVESLSSLEKRDAGAFKALRGYVYEAYYLQPRVQILIGYENHPTNQAGPHLKPFDEAILAEVRKKPKYYREV
jgi:hypothetical protein